MRSLSIVCFQRTLGTAASGHNQTYVALLQFSPKRSHQTKPICYAAAFSVAQNARYVMSGRRCSRPRWRLARSVSGPSGSTNERVLTANSSRSRPPKFTLAMTGLKCGADVARRRNRSEEIYKVGAQRLVTPGTKKLIEWPLFQKSNWRFRPEAVRRSSRNPTFDRGEAAVQPEPATRRRLALSRSSRLYCTSRCH
jgi:hypothetical protein